MKKPTSEIQEQTEQMLQELGIPENRLGYQYLCAAIIYYAESKAKNIQKEVYPYLCQRFGCSQVTEMECAIRMAIAAGRKSGCHDAWMRSFPVLDTVPPCGVVIATLAQRLK